MLNYQTLSIDYGKHELSMLNSMEKMVIIPLEEYNELKVIKSDFTSKLETAKGLVEDELRREKEESIKSLERQYKSDLERIVEVEVEIARNKASDSYARTYNTLTDRIRKLDADVEKADSRLFLVGAICFIIGMFLASAAGCVH